MGYTIRDAARDTGVSVEEAKKAFQDAEHQMDCEAAYVRNRQVKPKIGRGGSKADK